MAFLVSLCGHLCEYLCLCDFADVSLWLVCGSSCIYGFFYVILHFLSGPFVVHLGHFAAVCVCLSWFVSVPGQFASL